MRAAARERRERAVRVLADGPRRHPDRAVTSGRSGDVAADARSASRGCVPRSSAGARPPAVSLASRGGSAAGGRSSAFGCLPPCRHPPGRPLLSVLTPKTASSASADIATSSERRSHSAAIVPGVFPPGGIGRAAALDAALKAQPPARVLRTHVRSRPRLGAETIQTPRLRRSRGTASDFGCKRRRRAADRSRPALPDRSSGSCPGRLPPGIAGVHCRCSGMRYGTASICGL